jgi:hypothetical protein
VPLQAACSGSTSGFVLILAPDMRQLGHKKLIPKPFLLGYHSPIVNCNLFLLAHQLTNSSTYKLKNLPTQKLTNSYTSTALTNLYLLDGKIGQFV